MAIEPVPHPDPAPVPGPQRGDESTFDDRMDASIRWFETASQQFGDLGDNVVHNAEEAEASAATAASNASSASSSAVTASTAASAAAGSASAASTSAAQAAASAAGVQAAAGGATAIYYVFDTATADADPGPGKLRLGSATQNAATVIRTDLLDKFSTDMTALLDSMDDSTSTVKGQFRLTKLGDLTHWITFNMAAIATPAGYRNFTVAVTASSHTNPFANGDDLVLAWSRTGDRGQESITNVTPITTTTTLTAANIGYHPCSMTALGQSIIMPDATTLLTSNPRALVSNVRGAFAVGVRDNAGGLIGAVAPGGEAIVSLQDNTTAAGIWSMSGQGVEPGLVTIDSTLSNTYEPLPFIQHIDMGNGKSIHFLRANGTAAGYAVVIDNVTGAVGTPLMLEAANMVPKAVFQISATQAILFYQTGTDKAVVLTISGATTLAAGTAASTTINTILASEDWVGAPGLVQLSATLYAAIWYTSSVYTVAAISVSGTTVTFGTALQVFNNAGGGSTARVLAPLSATTFLVVYRSGASAPFANNAVVISVSGTTCTLNTPQALTGAGSGTAAIGSLLRLSATKLLLADDNNATSAVVTTITISGMTVTPGTALVVESGLANGVLTFTADGANRYVPHLTALGTNSAMLWYKVSGVSRNVVLNESGGVITPGNICYRAISAAADGTFGEGRMTPQGTDSFSVLAPSQSPADGGFMQVRSYKINGTAITPGTVRALPNIDQKMAELISARLPSGDHVCIGANVTGVVDRVQAVLPVWRTNGDQINMRGEIPLPPAAWYVTTGSTPAWPVQTVGNNRVVLWGGVLYGKSDSTNNRSMRVISVEIAQ